MPRSIHPPRYPLLALALLSGLCLGGVAQADYLGGITFSHATPNDLPHGAEITMSIDYKVDHPDGGRIFARPFTNGSHSPGYIASGGPLVPQGSGTVTQTFTIAHGGALVNEVRFTLVSPDQSEVFLEFFLPVHFQFGPHGVDNVQPDHTRHSCLRHGMPLNLVFDYAVEAAGCRIFARPFNNGQLVPGYTASGSGSLPPSGTHTQWFTFPQDADVTHIRFQIVDLDGETLAEVFRPWEGHWRAWGVYDISFNHGDLTNLHNSQNLVATFTVDHEDPDGLYAWVWCLRDGVYVPGTVYQPSPMIPMGGHEVTRYTRVNTGTEPVDAICMVVGSPTEVYLSFEVPLELHYGPHALQNFGFEPAPPAILSTGEQLFMSYDYFTDWPDDVLIFGRAAYHGDLLPGYIASGSPFYPPPSGSSSHGLFVSFDQERTADSIRFQMLNADQTTLLLEWFEPGWFLWGASGTVTGVEATPTLAAVLGHSYPNPFNPTATIPVQLTRDTHVELAVFDARGRLVRKLHEGALPAGDHAFVLHGEGLSSGAYICRLETPAGVQSQRLTLIK